MTEKYIIKNTAGLYIGNLVIGEDVTFVQKLAIAKTFVSEELASDFISNYSLIDVEIKKINVTVMVEEV